MPWTATVLSREKALGTVRIQYTLSNGIETFPGGQANVTTIADLKAQVNSRILQIEAAYAAYDLLPAPGAVIDVTPDPPPTVTAGNYIVSALAMAKGASKNYLSLFNNDPSLVVDVYTVKVVQELTAAVTGLTRGYRLFGITSHSVGTLVTPGRTDTTFPAPPANITARKDGQTVNTAGDPLGIVALNEEETASAGAETYLYRASDLGPLVLRNGQGIVIQQDSTAGTGALSALIAYRVR